MTAYTCPLCEAVGPGPCEDVLDCATHALLIADWQPSPLREALEAVGEAVVDVPFLVAQPGWPMALVDARTHQALGCADPSECETCWRSLSVLQINCFYWRTLDALADS